jgi:peroxiredoxin
MDKLTELPPDLPTPVDDGAGDRLFGASLPRTNRSGAQVFGLSTQTPEYQLEAKLRLHLPFELLSDRDLYFANAIELPMFEIEGKQLIKRITLIAEDSKMIEVFYPVFPPDRNADDVIDWLREHAVS